jgi:hypothetical protein
MAGRGWLYYRADSHKFRNRESRFGIGIGIEFIAILYAADRKNLIEDRPDRLAADRPPDGVFLAEVEDDHHNLIFPGQGDGRSVHNP